MSAEKAMNLYREYEVRRNHSFALTEHMVRYLFAKRFIDLMFSFIGLMLSTPIILLFALLIKLETPGPAFYMQERVGKDGVYFKLWKLRSMRTDAESGGAKWAQKTTHVSPKWEPSFVKQESMNSSIHQRVKRRNEYRRSASGKTDVYRRI